MLKILTLRSSATRRCTSVTLRITFWATRAEPAASRASPSRRLKSASRLKRRNSRFSRRPRWRHLKSSKLPRSSSCVKIRRKRSGSSRRTPGKTEKKLTVRKGMPLLWSRRLISRLLRISTLKISLQRRRLKRKIGWNSVRRTRRKELAEDLVSFVLKQLTIELSLMSSSIVLINTYFYVPF